MTNTPNPEPTLTDVIQKLDKLIENIEKLRYDLKKLTTKFKYPSSKITKFNTLFFDYKQTTQWMMRLSYFLMASATITVIITSVSK